MKGAVFETLRVRQGAVPLRDLHVARLQRSLAALGLPTPTGLAQALAPTDGAVEGVLRVEVSPDGIAVTTRDVPSLEPLEVVSVPGYRPYPHKTDQRTQFDAAMALARGRGADDALLLTADGVVAEGTVWSVFWWEGERLVTPSLTLGILPGVARARLAELRSLDEGLAGVEDLAERGCFAANSVRGVFPIRAVDGAPVRLDGRTAELATLFWPS